jgi:hypothetical protein
MVKETDMAHTLMHRILPFMDLDTWPSLRRHLPSKASAQRERDDIMGYFVD